MNLENVSHTELISVDGAEPVDLQTAKKWSFIIGEDDDGLVQSMLTAARDYAESYTWRALIEATYVMRLDRFPADIIELKVGPCIEVSSITYTDIGGQEQELDSSEYEVDTASHFARIRPFNGWPGTKDVFNAVKITFKAGCDGSSARYRVPPKVKAAIKFMVKHWTENRSAVVISEGRSVDAIEVPLSATHLLDLESKRHPS